MRNGVTTMTKTSPSHPHTHTHSHSHPLTHPLAHTHSLALILTLSRTLIRVKAIDFQPSHSVVGQVNIRATLQSARGVASALMCDKSSQRIKNRPKQARVQPRPPRYRHSGAAQVQAAELSRAACDFKLSRLLCTEFDIYIRYV